MGNEFSKLANSILSRALSKPATSLSSKAKAAIGLGGLAGAGALAHHYDMLLPNRVTSQLANEVVAPSANVNRVINEPVPTAVSRSIPVKPTEFPSLEVAAPSIPKPSINTASNARKVLQDVSKAQQTAEELEMLEAQQKAIERERTREQAELNDFLTGGDRPLVSYNFAGPDSKFNTQRLIHDARYSVLAPSGISDFLYNNKGKHFNELKRLDHYTLEQLVTARDVASYTGKKHLIPAINKKIDSMLDLLNSDKAREYNTRLWALDPQWNLSPFTPENPNKNALLRQWLNYDLNPWGAAKATDIPMDLDKGRLVEAGRLKGKTFQHFEPYVRPGLELEDMVSGVDYDSALNEAASGIKAKRYANKVVDFLEELRDEPVNSGKAKDLDDPEWFLTKQRKDPLYVRNAITKILESTENPLNARIVEEGYNMNPIINVSDYMINPGKFNQEDTFYRVAPHKLQNELYFSDYAKELIDSRRGTGKFLLRPGVSAINSFYSPIIDIDDENLIKIHRPKRKH